MENLSRMVRWSIVDEQHATTQVRCVHNRHLRNKIGDAKWTGLRQCEWRALPAQRVCHAVATGRAKGAEVARWVSSVRQTCKPSYATIMTDSHGMRTDRESRSGKQDKQAMVGNNMCVVCGGGTRHVTCSGSTRHERCATTQVRPTRWIA